MTGFSASYRGARQRAARGISFHPDRRETPGISGPSDRDAGCIAPEPNKREVGRFFFDSIEFPENLLIGR